MENWWQKPVTALKGIGYKRAEAFARLEIVTVGDLLNYYPRLDSYIDYSHLATIRELKTDGSRQIFEAEALRAVERVSGGGRRYAVITVKDETGYAEIFLFGAQRFQARRFKAGSRILVTGRVKPGRTAKAVSEVLLQFCDEESLDKSVGTDPAKSPGGGTAGVAAGEGVRAAGNHTGQHLQAIRILITHRSGEQHSFPRKRSPFPRGEKASGV